MRLTFEAFDGRQKIWRDVVDGDTGAKVGYIHSHGVGFGTTRIGGMVILLFGGRYYIEAHTYDECWGFVKGVEAVLNEMTSVRPITYADTPQIA